MFGIMVSSFDDHLSYGEVSFSINDVVLALGAVSLYIFGGQLRFSVNRLDCNNGIGRIGCLSWPFLIARDFRIPRLRSVRASNFGAGHSGPRLFRLPRIQHLYVLLLRSYYRGLFVALVERILGLTPVNRPTIQNFNYTFSNCLRQPLGSLILL